MESSRIFIRGLPPDFSLEDFKAHFSKQGTVTDLKHFSRRRMGYVGYKTPEDAARAVRYHNKTFIRMSRIGVELARSVEEQYAVQAAANANSVIKRSYEVTVGDSHQKSPGDAQGKYNQERGGEQSKGGKAKLQDFLEVMQPPSKSKIWENRAAPTANISPDPMLRSEVQKTIAARSGGEYEPMPKKQKVVHKEAKEDELAKGPTKFGETETEEVVRANTGTPAFVEQEMESPTNEAVATTHRASDADWLRSRTSRLLGLVNDDVAPEFAASPDYDGERDIPSPKPLQQVQSLDVPNPSPHLDQDGQQDCTSVEAAPSSGIEDLSPANGRLFVRNLTYTTTEDDLRQHFESGGYGTIEELHVPTNSRTGSNKGFAHVQYAERTAAAMALQSLDRKPFQGRLLHVMPGNAKTEMGLDEFAISKLPIKKQQQIKRKAEAASSTFNWNSMYMNSDAVMSSISDRLGVSKSDVLDPTSSDMAVKQAHAETYIIQETKSYFTTNGVDLNAFKQRKRGDTAILAKNFTYGTKPEELRNLFEPYGRLTQLLMPPFGTIAIIEYDHADHARSAFSSLAYRKFKDSILFLEKAPEGLFDGKSSSRRVSAIEPQTSKLSAKNLLKKDGLQEPVNTSTLFVRNLNFSTTTQRLHEIFQPLGGLLSARVKTKPDPKKPGQLLSMGFGFLEFQTKEHAQAALSAMDGYKLDGHELLIQASHRASDAAEERKKDDQAKKVAGRKTKIIIKNLPFEASRKDVRSLFGAYGQLRSVRVPKKFDSSTRGFAFAEFVTAREAENAMDSLRDTHLLGRRLVLEFAAEDAVDPEQEIEKMQRKVGKQADKVALQKLTGTARKKFNVEGGEEMDQG